VNVALQQFTCNK